MVKNKGIRVETHTLSDIQTRAIGQGLLLLEDTKQLNFCAYLPFFQRMKTCVLHICPCYLRGAVLMEGRMTEPDFDLVQESVT